MQYRAEKVNNLSRGDPQLDVQRQPPFNLEAEQALLGALLLSNETLDNVIDFLEAVHFFDPLHGQIYDHAARLIVSGRRATPVTLKAYFENAPAIDAGTSAVQYLFRLPARAPTTLNAREYARTI